MIKLTTIIFSAFFITLAAPASALGIADSVGVENLNGKKVILHKLDPKDNYYALGRRYNVSPKLIMQFNNNASMQIGRIIKVPTGRSVVEPTPPLTKAAALPPEQQIPVQNKPAAQQPETTATVTMTVQKPAPETQSITIQQYKVSRGETLYAIAKRFGTTVEDITAVNKLTSAIIPGQILQVRSGVPAPPPPPLPTMDSTIAKRDSTYVAADSLNRRIATNRYGLFEKNERGVATWIDDASLDPNKKLILHRTAPIGTVMRITNPMNNRITFAKVVGRFTDNQSTKDAIIVMTKNVAESLGALDKRFQVNISYGTPNE